VNDFNELKRDLESVIGQLQDFAETMKGKSAFGKASQLCDEAQHRLSQMQMELTRIDREFKETEELMK